jgi:CRP/FNR family transcriptional regulator, cyclic AMP receptor protein
MFWRASPMNTIISSEISSLSIFRDVETETIEKLKIKLKKVIIKKGTILFYEKDPIDYVYLVLRGKVALFRNLIDGHKKIFFILTDGDTINEVILDNLPASVSCEAFESSEILAISKLDLLELMKYDFKLTQNILNNMGKKVRRLYRQLKNTVPIKVDKRVAAKLWKLSKDYGLLTPAGTLINLNITVVYLSDMLGSARETVSRSLSLLEKKGLIMFQGKKIIVPSRDNLSRYFKDSN